MGVWDGYGGGPKEKKVGRKRRGCPEVMSGVSMSVVEFLQGSIQKQKLHID